MAWCYFVIPWPGLRTPCVCGGGTRATLAVVQILGGGSLRTTKALDRLQGSSPHHAAKVTHKTKPARQQQK